MPPSPYKRNRRMKSRLMAGSDDDRANLRAKAVQMMRATGGAMAPSGTSRPRSRSGDVVRGTKVPTGPNGPIATSHVPVRAAPPKPHAGDIVRRNKVNHDTYAGRGPIARAYVPGRGDSGMATHPRPTTSGRGPKPPIDPYAPRRTGDGGRATHPRPTTSGRGPKPALGPVRIRLKPESGGTGNHAAPQTAVKNDTLDKGARRPVAKRPASAYDNRLSSLARQRALSGNRNNRGTRALLSVAPRDTDTGGAAWRQSRAYRMGRSIRRRRARRWLRNTAQGPSRPQYS